MIDLSDKKYFVLKDFSTIVDVLSMIRKSKKSFSIDIETTALKPWRGEILGVGLSWEAKSGIYIPIHVRDIGLWAGDLEQFWSIAEYEQIVGLFKDLLEQEGPIKVAHQAGFEINWFSSKWAIIPVDMFDTLLYRFVQNPNTSVGYETKLGLGYIVEENYPDLKGLKDIWKGIKEDKNGDKDLSLYCDTDKIGYYCCGDCDATFREYLKDKRDIVGKPFEVLFSKRLMPAVSFVAETSQSGMLVDIEYLNSKRIELKNECAGVLDKIQDIVGDLNFNPGSDVHLKAYFFNKMKAPKLNKEHLDYSVLREYDLKYGLPVAADILNYRRLMKLIGTYFDGLENVLDPMTGRVHSDFLLHGTETGRLSSRNPNLQNQPRGTDVVKRLFIAPEGYVMVGADYSQIELRLLAMYSQDSLLLDAYRRGLDLHALTASILFGIPIEKVTKYQRYVGKTSNFMLCYGGGAGNLVYGKSGLGNKIMGPEYAKRKGMLYEDLDRIIIPHDILMTRAKSLRRKYFEGYSRIEPWRQEVIKQARIDGYVTSSYGRIRYLPGIRSHDDNVRTHAERQAVNMPPQGTASDYLLFHFMDMMKDFKQRQWDVNSCCMVHDQLVMYVEEDICEKVTALIPELGTALDEAKITVPMLLEPSIGKHLGEV